MAVLGFGNFSAFDQSRKAKTHINLFYIADIRLTTSSWQCEMQILDEKAENIIRS